MQGLFALFLLEILLLSGVYVVCTADRSNCTAGVCDDAGEEDAPATFCLIGTNSMLNSWTDVPASAEMPSMLTIRSADDGRLVVSHILTTIAVELQPGYESVFALSARYDYNKVAPRITFLNSYMYHPWLSSWLELPHGNNPTPPRHAFSLAWSPVQRYVVFYGGFRNDPFVNMHDKGLLGDIWVFDLTEAEWTCQNVSTSSPTIVTARAGHSAVVLRSITTVSTEDRMVVFGGFTQSAYTTADMLILDMESWTWSQIDHDNRTLWPGPRILQKASVTVDNTMLMFGSLSEQGIVALDLWEFNMAAMEWTQLPELNWTIIEKAGCNYDRFTSLFLPNTAQYYSGLDTLFVFPFWEGTPWMPESRWWQRGYGESPCTCMYNRSMVDPSWHCVAMATSQPLDNNFEWLAAAGGKYGIYHFAFSYDLLMPTEWLVNYTADKYSVWVTSFTRYQVSSLSVPYHRALSTANYHAKSATIFLFGGLKLIDKVPYQERLTAYDSDLATNDLWIYVLTRQAWSRLRLNGTPPPRYAHASTIILDKVLAVFSGFHAFTMSKRNILWCFDLNALNWYTGPEVSDTLHDILWRGYSVIGYLPGTNELVVHGGFSPSSITAGYRPYNDTWVFRFDVNENNDTQCSGEWSNLNCKNTPRIMGHTSEVYGGNIIVFGGATFDGFYSSYDLQVLNETWLMSRNADGSCQWQKMETVRANNKASQDHMVEPRLWHASALIGAQMVVAGGCVPTGPCADLTSPLNCCKMENRVGMGYVWVLDLVTYQWTYIIMGSTSLFHAGMHSAVAIGDSMHIIDGLRGGGISNPDENLRPALLRHDYKSTLASPPGVRTSSFAEANWTSCYANSYSDKVGSTACSPCPDGTTTAESGAVSLQSCRYCSSETVCHGHGTCVVNAHYQPLCDCQIGYLSTDNCRLPLMYLYSGAGGVFVFLIVICVVLCRLYKTRQVKEAVTQRRLQRSRSQVAQLNSAWQIDYLELSLTKRLDGESPGAFGEVWLAKYREMPVAVKKLKTVQIEQRSRKEFEREVSLMKTLRHANIVLFLGAGLDGLQPFLVVEYMARGTLSSLLRSETTAVDKQQQVRWALDIAKGIRYLHGLFPPRIHRDLKTSNILLSERWVAKVADFGTARLVNDIADLSPVAPLESDDFEELSARLMSASYRSSGHDLENAALLSSTNSTGLMTRNAGTLLWCSPEVLAGKPYGASTDVYSFGIILWELCSRKIPFSEFPDFKWMSKISDGVEAGRRPTIPGDCHASMRQLIETCWSGSPEDRPTFKAIVSKLDDILEQIG